MEFNLATTRNGVQIDPTTPVNPENIRLSESSQSPHTSFDSVYMKCPEQPNPQRWEVDSWLPGAGGGEH